MRSREIEFHLFVGLPCNFIIFDIEILKIFGGYSLFCESGEVSRERQSQHSRPSVPVDIKRCLLV